MMHSSSFVNHEYSMGRAQRAAYVDFGRYCWTFGPYKKLHPEEYTRHCIAHVTVNRITPSGAQILH
jgi:hypothetical protein